MGLPSNREIFCYPHEIDGMPSEFRVAGQSLEAAPDAGAERARVLDALAPRRHRGMAGA